MVKSWNNTKRVDEYLEDYKERAGCYKLKSILERPGDIMESAGDMLKKIAGEFREGFSPGLKGDTANPRFTAKQRKEESLMKQDRSYAVGTILGRALSVLLASEGN